MQSSLWFVLLVALGLRVATGTWNNLKRGSVEYHRHLADVSEGMSARHRRIAAEREDELRSQPSDSAVAARLREEATAWADGARWDSLQAAALADRAEACERSRVGWISLQYATWRHPPNIPVLHGPDRFGRPWVESGTFLHSALMTLAHVDFPGLACLALAIVLRWSFAPARRVEDDATRRVASAPGAQ